MESNNQNMLNLVLLIFLNFLFLSSTLITETQSADSSSDHHEKHIMMKQHFVLIHGACHGAWSWYKVSNLLQSAGHKVTALDMAASGVDMRYSTAENLTSFSDYVEPLMDFMGGLGFGEKVILVGHSQGGLVISKAMEEFSDQISVAVFVSAAMPGPTLNVSILLHEFGKRIDFGPDSHFTYGNGMTKPPTTLTFGPLFLATKMYQNSPKQDLTLAKTLMRATHLFGEQILGKQLNLSKERYGSVKRVVVVLENDLIIKRSFQNWVFQRNQPTQVLQIKGSDHMAMMSKPFALFKKLQHIAQQYS